MHSLLETFLMLLRDLLSQKTQSMVDQYVQALDVLPDDAMRHARFVQWIQPLPDELLLDALSLLQEGAQTDRPRYRAVLGSLLDVTSLHATLGEARLERLRELARQQGLAAVYAVLASEPPWRRYYASKHLDVNEQLESSPLGWRKALARGTNRAMLERLLYDKHPQVIEILLNNPRVLERDVVKMAALQPTSEHALRTIFSHPRWIRRYTIKKALVFNPYAATSMVRNLLGFLLEPDLRDASRSKRLSPEVRAFAKELLALKLERRRPLQLAFSDGVSVLKPRTGQAAEQSSLAAQFLASLDSAEDALAMLEGELEAEAVERSGAALDEEGADEEADAVEAFLAELPDQLPLIPVGEDDE